MNEKVVEVELPRTTRCSMNRGREAKKEAIVIERKKVKQGEDVVSNRT